MKRIRLDILAIAIVGLAVLWPPALNYITQRNASPATAPSARIGTIDLEKVYNSIDAYKSKLEAIKVVEENLKAQAETQQAGIKDLEAEFESYQPGSEAQLKSMTQLQNAVGELRALQVFAQNKIEAMQARALRDAYLLVKDATKRFAEKESFDYVMLDDSIPQMESSNSKQMLAQISARRFLFATPANDITAQLVAMLNVEFKAAGAAATQAPTTPTAPVAAPTAPAATTSGAPTGG
ncbi:MAG: OmpH family outer membrane protein [Phycisphaerales bacterium]|nr:OmpH family outer membrane protein [Phycisphaerales bacterium]